MSLVNEAKARLKLYLLAGPEGFLDVEIPEIPKEWEKFPDSEDEWINIPMPNTENSTACLYKGKQGSYFKPHRHLNAKEHLTIMNEGGKMTLITKTKIEVIEYPNSCVIPKGEIHAVEFETNTVIMCVWHPMFKKGWSASFKKEKDE